MIFTISHAYGQSDDFSDGDFTANPAWTGNTASFSVFTDTTLPGGSAVTDGFFLGSNASTGNAVLTTASSEVSEWKFSWGSGNWNPSTTNYFGVILMSNQSGAITSSGWTGYFLKIGSSASNDSDKIELWKKNGGTGSGTKVGDFPSSPTVGGGQLKDGLDIRITRSNTGIFTLYYSSGFTYQSLPTTSAGTLTDNTITSSSYFGIYQIFANPSAARRNYIDNIVLGTAPSINVSTTAVSGLDYISGNGPSASKNFTISGANLSPTTGNNVIYVSSTAGKFEYSTDNITFTEDFTSFTFSGSSFSKTIYVRLKAGLAVGSYSDVIDVGYYNDSNSPYNIDKTLSVSGEVTSPPVPVISLGTFTTTAMNYPLGTGPSASKNATISGTNLTSDVTVSTSNSSFWELSQTGLDGSWSSSVTYVRSGTTIGSNNKIFVRLKSGLSVNAYSGLLTASSSGATSQNFSLSGEVFQPVITLVGTPTQFTYAQGQGPSAAQSVTVSGTNLASNITVSVPASNWEISTNAAFETPASSIILTKNVSNAVASTAIYIRLKEGLPQGQYDFSTTTDLQVTSTNAVTRSADLNGEVTEPKAELLVKGVYSTGGTSNVIVNGDITPSILDNTEFASQNIGDSQTKTFRLESVGGLSLDVTSISLDNTGDFFVTASPPYNIASHAYQDFTITFRPTAVGDRTAVVTIASSDLSDSIYTFTLLGLGKNPEIGLSGNGVEIPNGNTNVSNADNTIIGNANSNSSNSTTVSKTFVISNTGNIALTVSSVSIIGADASQFSVSPINASIAVGATGNLTVTFSPTSSGVKKAVISIANNDATDNENPYTFTVQGNASDFIACAAGESISYQTGFESSDGFVSSNTYNNSTVAYTGASGRQWGTYYGTPSTTSAIIDDQSMQMRWYTSNPNNHGYTFTNFNIANLSKVVFSASSTNSINVVVSYSIDGGTNWLGDQTFTLSGTPTDYNYILPMTVPSARVRFLLTYITAPSATSRLYLDNVRIYQAVDNSKTWNGTVWSGDGLPPTSSQRAIIDGNLTLPYEIGGTTYNTIEACECQINSGKTLTIGVTDNINNTSVPADAIIQSKMTNNGSLVLASDSNLMQLDDFADNAFLANSVVVKRFARLPRMGYNFWSSPVATQNLYSFSKGGQAGGTPKNRFFIYDEATDLFKNTGAFLLNDASAFESGRGYAIRGMQDFSVSMPTMSYEFSFSGTPNNGNVAFSTLKYTSDEKGYNLVGNPYPSNIDFDKLYDANSNKMYATAYFWTNNDMTISQQQGSNYQGNNYAIYNLTGGVPASQIDADPNQPASALAPPTNIIKVGQGFIIKAKAAGKDQPLNFSNDMRSVSTGTFYNNRNLAEKDKFWLRLTSPDNIANTVLIGYLPNATNDFEMDFDAELLVVGSDSFYSILGSRKLGIQGRQSFEKSDKVNLGGVYSQNGQYRISMIGKEGVFKNGQTVYLKDKILNKYIDLSKGDYSFQAVKGIDHTRFEIVYELQDVLAAGTSAKSEFVIYKSGDDYIISSSQKLGKVDLFDAAGRLIRSFYSSDNKQTINVADLSHGIYILRVENSGETRTQKIIK